MNKRRLILACLVVFAVLAGMTGCMLPDFGLSFDVIGITEGPGNTYSIVSYSVTNTGSKTVSSLSLNIDVVYLNSSLVQVGSDSKWMTVGTVGAGATTTASVTFYHTTGWTTAEPRVIDMTWDQES
jgi:hypothetical protein